MDNHLAASKTFLYYKLKFYILDGATVAKEGENCEGFNEFTGNPFPNCETGLVCKHTAEMSIPGAGKTCVKTGNKR